MSLKNTNRNASKGQVDASANTSLLGGLSTHASATGLGGSPDLPLEFGRYRLLKQLGVGGMGTVFLAHDTELDRKVALKLPHFGNTNNTHVERFRREARLSATLDHPNICRVYDIGEHEGRLFLTMAYIEGNSLHDVIRAKGAIDPRVAAKLMRGIAKTVQLAHTQGIIHRDLKPANIMIKKNKDFVIMDFGLARRIEQDDEQITATGAVLGTPAYMAPEQLRGESNAIGPQSDVYSLGIILFELLAGQRPFQGTLPQIYSQVLTSDSVANSTIEHSIDPILHKICEKATKGKVEERFKSASELASALEAYLASPVTSNDQSKAQSPGLERKAIAISSKVAKTQLPAVQANLKASKHLVPIVVLSCLATTLLVLCVTYLLRSPSSIPAENKEALALNKAPADGKGLRLEETNASPQPENAISASPPSLQVLPPTAEPPSAELKDLELRGQDKDSLGAEPIPSLPTEIDSSSISPSEPPPPTPAASLMPSPESVRKIDVRTWKDSSGAFGTEASMVSSTEKEVTIKKTDGKTITIQRATLAKDDQEYIAASEMLVLIDENQKKLEPYLQKLILDPRSVIEPISAIQKKGRDPISSLWCGVVYATEGGKPGLDEAEKYHDDAIQKLRIIAKHFPSAHQKTLVSALNNRAILALRERKTSRAITSFKEIGESQTEFPDFASHNIELLLEVTRENSFWKLSNSERRALTDFAVQSQANRPKSLPKRFMYSVALSSVTSSNTSQLGLNQLGALRLEGLWPELTCFLCDGTSALRCLTCGGDGTISSVVPEKIGFNDKTNQAIMGRKTIQVRCNDCNGSGGFKCKNCNGGRLRLE